MNDVTDETLLAILLWCETDQEIADSIGLTVEELAALEYSD